MSRRSKKRTPNLMERRIKIELGLEIAKILGLTQLEKEDEGVVINK